MDPIQKALAELRAIPTRQAEPAEEPATNCCDGSRRSYNRHKRYGEEACAESKAAAAAYMAAYVERTGGYAAVQARRRRRAAA